MNNTRDTSPEIDFDDPRFRIKPYQQILASCTGALITSIFGNVMIQLLLFLIILEADVNFDFIVTPLDVVKTRLQAQQKATLSNKCFLYCNGLMDHLCPCLNGKTSWTKPNEKIHGTMVSN